MRKIKAEGKGFHPARFSKLLHETNLDVSSLTGPSLLTSGCSRLIPFISGYEGGRQGQIRDNCTNRRLGLGWLLSCFVTAAAFGAVVVKGADDASDDETNSNLRLAQDAANRNLPDIVPRQSKGLTPEDICCHLREQPNQASAGKRASVRVSRPATSRQPSPPAIRKLKVDAAAESSCELETLTVPQGGTSGIANPDIRPRPKRRKSRAREDRGLPPDVEIAALAKAYLERQRTLWPAFAASGLLPVPEPEVIAAMVENFKQRHRGWKPTTFDSSLGRDIFASVGGFYGRYSCDNSTPNSIIDQMVNGLDKGRDEDCFIPWQYVYSDYSVSGTDSSRQGYTSYKAVLLDPEHSIRTTYIDDFTRASRDEREWWELAESSKESNKRMIGASDGFDLSSPDCDIKITIYGLVSRLFLKGLREKVTRGMKAAARRKTVLGKLPLGFTRKIKRDEHGNIVRRADGRPRHEPCIDPQTYAFGKELFELYVERGLSGYKIAQRFNTLRVEDWDGWNESTIDKMLANPAYIGVFIWNRSYKVFDRKRKKWVVKKRPRQEWEVYFDPTLAIIPMEWWRKACRKRSASRQASKLTGRKVTRNEKSATTIFSGTLFCKCGNEIKLGRSTGDSKSMYCLNGRSGAHGCTLTSYKSTRIIESSLLHFLWTSVANEERIADLVKKANTFLALEATKPRTDTSGLRSAERQAETRLGRLRQRLGDYEGEDRGVITEYETQISVTKNDLSIIRSKLAEAARTDTPPPPPLNAERIKEYLGELRSVLNQEPAAVAPVLRSITGQITVEQRNYQGKKKGAEWIATFSPQLINFLAAVAKDRQHPDSLTLEYLKSRNWMPPIPAEVVLPVFAMDEDLRAKVLALREHQTIAMIAATLEIGVTRVRTLLGLPKSPSMCKPRKRDKSQESRRAGVPKYQQIASEVQNLRSQGHTWESIVAIIGVSMPTAMRAYDLATRDSSLNDIQEGRRPRRSVNSRLSVGQAEMLRTMVEACEPSHKIIEAVKCSDSSIVLARRDYLRRLIASSGGELSVQALAERSGCRVATVAQELERWNSNP
jgi:DNA invertase Pin-like site-specific DNA recombinase